MKRAAVCLVLILAACRGKGEPAAGQPSAVAVAATSAAAPGPAPVAAPPPFVPDALWTQASGGDEIDLARLAAREGAAGLLQGVEQGGSVGRTGLAALALADDGELALGRLCEILARTPGEQVEPVLRAVHAIVARPPTQRERLDPTGYRACAPVVSALAARQELRADLRDLASSAHEALVERGAAK